MTNEFDALFQRAEAAHESGVEWPAVEISTVTVFLLRQRLEDAANQHTLAQRIIEDRDRTIQLLNLQHNEDIAKLAERTLMVDRIFEWLGAHHPAVLGQLNEALREDK